jgi:hypothetical protein
LWVADHRIGFRNLNKEVVFEEKNYEKPEVIVEKIEALDKERAELLNKLKEMLK